MAMVRDHESVLADNDVVGANREHGGKNADLDLKIRGFSSADRKEAGIFGSGGNCGFHDGLVKRVRGEDVSDATPQMTIQVKRGECTTILSKVFRRRSNFQGSACDVCTNRLMSQTKELIPLFFRIRNSFGLEFLTHGVQVRLGPN